jgi:hypothetical protein
MGTEDGGSAGDAVCQVNECSLSIKWHATIKSSNRPISLCEKHGTEYSQKGLVREMVSV